MLVVVFSGCTLEPDYVDPASELTISDLSEQHFKERDIHYICFHYELDGKDYPDDLGKTIAFADFYAAMTNGAETKTSQINAEEYE